MGSFTKSKSYIPKEARNGKGMTKKNKSRSSTVSSPPLGGTRTSGDGAMEVNFLITPPRMGGKQLAKEIRTPPVRPINGKATYRATINFIGRKCGIRSELVKRPLSFGLFGTKRLQSMSGGLASPRCQFPNNVRFVSLTRANRLNTNFGIVSKPGGCGDGPHSLCMNFVGLGPGTTTASTGNNRSLEKGSRVDMGRKAKFGISLGALPFGPFGLNVMTRSSTMSNGTIPRSITAFGMTLLSMPKWLGTG